MNIVTFREPKLKPMPGELTQERVSGAVLPLKIAAMSRAVADCTDLPQLMTYKQPIEALAAIAKALRKTMPQAARDMNRVSKELIFRQGELLLQYEGAPIRRPGTHGPSQSERAEVAELIGLDMTRHVVPSVRLAAAPPTVRDTILADDRIPANAQRMAKSAPRRTTAGGFVYSEVARAFFSGMTGKSYSNSGRGLTNVLSAMRHIDASLVLQLTAEERQRAKAIITEMRGLLDAIDKHLTVERK